MAYFMEKKAVSSKLIERAVKNRILKNVLGAKSESIRNAFLRDTKSQLMSMRNRIARSANAGLLSKLRNERASLMAEKIYRPVYSDLFKTFGGEGKTVKEIMRQKSFKKALTESIRARKKSGDLTPRDLRKIKHLSRTINIKLVPKVDEIRKIDALGKKLENFFPYKVELLAEQKRKADELRSKRLRLGALGLGALGLGTGGIILSKKRKNKEK